VKSEKWRVESGKRLKKRKVTRYKRAENGEKRNESRQNTESREQID
jgi:hypothetical protein